MLYKKIHRQFLREFKVGRKYRFGGVVFEITGKPYICGRYIRVDEVNIFEEWTYDTYDIIIALDNGKMSIKIKDIITWLD